MQIRPTLAAAIETLRPILVHGESIIVEISKGETYFATIASDILQYCILPLIRRQRYSQDTLQPYKQPFHDFMNKYAINYKYNPCGEQAYNLSRKKLLADNLRSSLSTIMLTQCNGHPVIVPPNRNNRYPTEPRIKNVLTKFIKGRGNDPAGYYILPCGLLLICYHKNGAVSQSSTSEKHRYVLLDPISLNYQKIQLPKIANKGAYLLYDDYGNIHKYDTDCEIYNYSGLSTRRVLCYIVD